MLHDSGPGLTRKMYDPAGRRARRARAPTAGCCCTRNGTLPARKACRAPEPDPNTHLKAAKSPLARPDQTCPPRRLPRRLPRRDSPGGPSARSSTTKPRDGPRPPVPSSPWATSAAGVSSLIKPRGTRCGHSGPASAAPAPIPVVDDQIPPRNPVPQPRGSSGFRIGRVLCEHENAMRDVL